MAGFFPMFVRLAGRIVVVVGGNETAARTVDALIACDAEVRVISPTFCPQLRRLRGTPNLTLIARSLEHGDLEDALLAIAVDDDPTVNLRAAREGLEWNVLVTVADELALSDFVVPSFVHRGKLTLALHAGTHDAVLGQRLLVAGLTGGQHVEILQALVLDQRLVQRGVAVDDVDEVVDYPALAAHDEIQVTQADIEVDDDGFVPSQGESGAQCGAGSGFTHASLAGSNNEDLGQGKSPLNE